MRVAVNNSFLFLFLVFSSCENEIIIDEDIDHVFYKSPSFKIDGVYAVASFNSEKPLDLNGDGIYSKDLLAESDQWKNSKDYFAQFFNDDQGTANPKKYVPKLFVWVPKPGVVIENEDGNKKFLNRKYGLCNLDARCAYSERKNTIKIWEGFGGGNGVVVSAKVDNDTLTIQFEQEYYTSNDLRYADSNWELIKITAVYKKFVSRPGYLYISPLPG
jgi:hypothetical protein